MAFSIKLKSIILKFLEYISKDQVNDKYNILPDAVLKEISNEEEVSREKAIQLYKEIYSLRPNTFKEYLDQVDFNRIENKNFDLSLFLNINNYADYLNLEFQLKLKNRDEVYLEAALNGSPNYKHSSSALHRKGYENTSLSSFSNDLYI
jgi:hypothetical protein